MVYMDVTGRPPMAFGHPDNESSVTGYYVALSGS